MLFLISFVILVSNYREHVKRMYELEMRVFYLEDVVGFYFYGDISDQYQTDFSGGNIDDQ